jgi:hypothetical protein
MDVLAEVMGPSDGFERERTSQPPATVPAARRAAVRRSASLREMGSLMVIEYR